ncbi:GH39 family glycosyl hydrolase [Pseudactinotalea sp.]|uniref:GH39 family glycosyl hydrolase n=1 Tax=Pseudactinotalea sp. TaxID=1926260 RepID=UPI003B3B8E58
MTTELPGLRPVGTLRGPVRGRPGTQSRFGIGFEGLDRRLFEPDRVYPWLGELGAGWARVQSGWSRCEREPGVYDFGWLDEIVDALAQRGVRTLMSLTFGNQLYSPEAPHESAVGYTPVHAGEAAVRAWQAYVAALVAHLRGRVNHWEVWNEPNIPQFWAPEREDGRDYSRLVEATADAVRRVDPEAFIVGGAQSQIDPMFLQECLEAGMAEHIDAFSFHPYQAVPEHDLRMMHDLGRGLLDRYSPGRRIELWQGEAGCPSQAHGHNDDWLGLYSIDEDVQATWVARRLVADRLIGFDRAFYFHVVDLMAAEYRQSDGRARPPVLMGLLNGQTYEPKLSFEAYRRVAAVFDDETVPRPLLWRMEEPETPAPQRSEVLAAPHVGTFVRDGAPLVAYWVSTDPQQRAGPWQIEVEAWWDRELTLRRPVVVDVVSGRVYAVDRSAPVQPPTLGPVLGERFSLPIADRPLILTDLDVLDVRLQDAHPESADPLGSLRALRYPRRRDPSSLSARGSG